jgi:DNA polymerase-3 subunit alpha
MEVEEWSQTEKLQNEFSAIGFYTSSHPIQQYENILKQGRFSSLAEAKELSKSRIVVIINDFSIKTTKTQNKFCILQISDPSGICEVTMFSEAFSNNRDLIEIGNIVVLDVACHKNEDQLRMLVDKIQKFDPNRAVETYGKPRSKKTTESKRELHKSLQIRIDSKRELLAVKDLIDYFQKYGNHSIELILPENKKILLQDRYFVSSRDILDLRSAIGISKVVEIVKSSDDRKALQVDDETG